MKETTDKKVASIIVAMASFLTPFMSSAVSVALPSIGKDFAADAVTLSRIPTSYLLAAAMFLVPFGKLADLKGRKNIFLFGIFLFMSASFFASISVSATSLIFIHFLMGIGSSMIFATGIAILTSVYPVGERGKALGINVATIYFGQSFGPFLGGIITQHLGWRAIFYVNILIAFTALLLVIFKFDLEKNNKKAGDFNYINAALYSLSFLLLIYGLSSLPEQAGFLSVFMGVVGILVFLAREARVEHPLIDLNLFRKNRVFLFSNLAALINFSATYAVVFILSLYLQFIQMLSPANAGILLVSKAVIQGLFSPTTGGLSDKIEPRYIASIGMGIITVALFMFSFLSFDTPLSFVFLNLVVLGFGIALFAPPNNNAIMSSICNKHYGVSSAILGTMRLSGQLLSMSFVMLIFTIMMGRVEITAGNQSIFLKSIRTIFFVFTVLSTGGLFASLARGQVNSRDVEVAKRNV